MVWNIAEGQDWWVETHLLIFSKYICIWLYTHMYTHTQRDRYTHLYYSYIKIACVPLLWTSMTGFPVMPFFWNTSLLPLSIPPGFHYAILPLDDLISSSPLSYINMYGWSRGSTDRGRVCEKARLTWQLDWALVLFTLTYAGKDKSRAEVCSGLAHPQKVAPKATFSLPKTPALQASAACSTSLLDFLLPQQIQRASN